MKNKISRLLAITAASLAVTFGAAYAAQGDMPMGGPGGPGGWHHGGFEKQLNQLHAQLKLSPDQEKQWQDALNTMKQNRDAARKSHEQMHDQFKAMQQQPILDLNALHDAHVKAQQQDEQLREQTAQAWLAFYNGLNDQQKTIVSTALKQHFAKMEQFREKMEQHWEHHHQDKGAASDAMPAQ
ncbi:periplasmic heavy metal sensor [Trinickia terrae]|uniref:Periplasmic heavy metal sensor n=1 Tax=Trinickia terrae TaxID=2571161 RepID=A0A4U1HNW5_9BURK|nr:periplasmic heavy metal sensor [Trinickia terrae]TKC83069.1 periplasmic heavy metal sensor [Trinickia terrae]